MNLNALFDQFIGSATGGQSSQAGARQAQGGIGDIVGKLSNGPAGSFAGGMAAGGLLGALMGNKKMRKKAGKLAGGALGYGGSAVLGALALKAYQNWQAGSARQEASAAQPQPQAALPSPEAFDPALTQDATGQPMQLTLIKAMVAASNADGHIDSQEQAAVFDAVDAVQLDAESKALIFDMLRNPPTIAQIAGRAKGLEQASEIYLASRLAIDPDHPAEQHYLKELAKAMALPGELVKQIEMQVAGDSSDQVAADEHPTHAGTVWKPSQGREADLSHSGTM